MPGEENRIHRTMPAAEDQANCYNRENAREKNDGRELGSAPQVSGMPPDGAERVAVPQEAGNHPNRKHNPRVKKRRLELPDVPANEGSESKSFDEGEVARGVGRHRRANPRGALRQDD